jgi:uncharacterized membrane protein
MTILGIFMKKEIILTAIALFLVTGFIIFQNSTTNIVIDTRPSETTVSVENVSYSRDIYPLVERRCIKCHSGDFPSEGLNLESYESLMSGSQNGQVIVAGDSNNSLLFEKIKSGEMPKRGSDLTAEQIQLIQQWIDEGALNN